MTNIAVRHGKGRGENDKCHANPSVGIGYRSSLNPWILNNLHRFDVLEITVDDCINGSDAAVSTIFDLVGRIPLTAHGVGLSLGTDVPLDLDYLDEIAEVVARLEAPAYSEHLAFTRVPGRELGNLLPLPRTKKIAESICAKVRTVQARVGVPFLLENISYLFEWPDSELSDAEFAGLICRETGAGWLLDVENLHLNAANHGADPYEFINALPAHVVREVHVAGGQTIYGSSLGRRQRLERPFLADTHSHPVSDATLDLLDHVLRCQKPAALILERDERFEAADEILDDIRRIRARFAALQPECT